MARDPAIFCLTSSRTPHGTRNFFACREVLAGCRGAALTKWSLEYRPCGGNTNMYLVPIFSPERWQSVGSSAPLSPPQERTVSRRRRETTKCASALNARMFFSTAATTATQNSGERTANHFAVFVQEPRHTISKPMATEIHEVRTYMLPSGDDNMCGLRRSKNRETTGIFGTGCAIV
mgnify:CR=1 FL=1